MKGQAEGMGARGTWGRQGTSPSSGRAGQGLPEEETSVLQKYNSSIY